MDTRLFTDILTHLVLNAVAVVCKSLYSFPECHVLVVISTFARNVGIFFQFLAGKILLPAQGALSKSLFEVRYIKVIEYFVYDYTQQQRCMINQ